MIKYITIKININTPKGGVQYELSDMLITMANQSAKLCWGLMVTVSGRILLRPLLAAKVLLIKLKCSSKTVN
ncbi:hypothetical protein L323_14230 [Ruminiclostridium papyrosolvens C7]|uniref:Uncharacterized protein n=1 Tax=Ruminiclostridium papyrosolvens C7 TaxID=1330534 RepID=U4QZ91_9FIRM|nr:hypothetical protein L323_14230 [Ruminiclostridium papyrosolvens C7]